ncbi:MAG TPA: FadR/GntR family transcriptional regulator [Blastocatellia bacterium]|nr:FadR/GntR family transcriptional regulator [Blastocatellia bacterium]HMV83811.1 FadR/GntR family transcriptional regulator [Blastocatellia bacterium]HMX30290.1 FadR/GntR family transcriptional regulator [Blastocatellia bacterium]HNG33515.1 FadR/GntR family transcriptional regulator [Blastocatellia bacterium]
MTKAEVFGSSRTDGNSQNGQTSAQVVARIRTMITRGDLHPGDRLPAERELSKQLGISRPSLRAGIRTLVALGVLQSRHGSGTYVAERPALDSEQIRLMAALHGFTFDQLFEARHVLEVQIAGLAAERASGDALATLAEELADMYAALTDPQQYLIHDIKFHRALAAASGNPILAALVEMVSAVMYDRRRDTIARAHDFSESLAMHQRIYRAVRQGKADEARAAMHEHLLLAQQAYRTEETSRPQTKAPPARSAKRKSKD